MYAVNPGKFARTYNGVRFPRGIFKVTPEQVEKAKADPTGRVKVQLNRLVLLFESLHEVEEAFSPEEVHALIYATFAQYESFQMRILRLREFWGGFEHPEVREYLTKTRYEWENGLNSKSRFMPTGETLRIELE